MGEKNFVGHGKRWGKRKGVYGRFKYRNGCGEKYERICDERGPQPSSQVKLKPGAGLLFP